MTTSSAGELELGLRVGSEMSGETTELRNVSHLAQKESFNRANPPGDRFIAIFMEHGESACYLHDASH